jgi:methyltransferase
MLGLKCHLNVLKSELEKAEVASSTHTEFSQGHTTRWGLAWTFFPELNLEMTSKNKKKKKPPAPMKHIVPMPNNPLYYNVSTVANKLVALFTQLQVWTFNIC